MENDFLKVDIPIECKGVRSRFGHGLMASRTRDEEGRTDGPLELPIIVKGTLLLNPDNSVIDARVACPFNKGRYCKADENASDSNYANCPYDFVIQL